MMHISDDASSVTIKTNKVFGDNVNTYQKFIESVNDRMFTGEKLATTSEYGIGKLSSKLESNDDLLTLEIFKNIKFEKNSSETEYGRTIQESNKSSLTSKTSNKTINPKTAKYFIDNFVATNKDYGFIKTISNTHLKNYTGSDVAINIDNLSYSMDYMIPKMGKATTSNSGIVRLATVAEMNEGKLNNGYAISPKKFHSLDATTVNYGTKKLSSDTDFNQFDKNSLVTPKNMGKYIKTFSDMDNKLRKYELGLATNDNNREKYIRTEIEKILSNKSSESLGKFIRVGDITFSLKREERRSQYYMIPMGQFLDSVEYSELFKVIGYKYGKSGTKFKLPDVRGMYFRGVGLGSFITNHEKFKRHYIEKEVPKLGEVQKQMVARHKHGGNYCDQSKWGSSFGHTGNWGWYGSNGEHWGCNAQYHTDGGEIVSESGIKDYPNPEGMINEDKETRPWSFTINVYMRVK